MNALRAFLSDKAGSAAIEMSLLTSLVGLAVLATAANAELGIASVADRLQRALMPESAATAVVVHDHGAGTGLILVADDDRDGGVCTVSVASRACR